MIECQKCKSLFKNFGEFFDMQPKSRVFTKEVNLKVGSCKHCNHAWDLLKKRKMDNK